MGTENQNNRSTAITPEIAAHVNAAITDGIRTAMQEMLSQFTPMLRDLNKPYVDPIVEQRKLRDKLKFKADEIQGEKDKRLRREQCDHTYITTGKLAISAVRNFPDNRERGICMICQEWFAPREWSFNAPSEDHLDGNPHIVEAHPQYRLVGLAIRQKEQQ